MNFGKPKGNEQTDLELGPTTEKLLAIIRQYTGVNPAVHGPDTAKIIEALSQGTEVNYETIPPVNHAVLLGISLINLIENWVGSYEGRDIAVGKRLGAIMDLWTGLDANQVWRSADGQGVNAMIMVKPAINAAMIRYEAARHYNEKYKDADQLHQAECDIYVSALTTLVDACSGNKAATLACVHLNEIFREKL